MRTHEPFQPEDLDELGDFLDRATSVVAMQEVAALEQVDARVIGMRHDCDNVIWPAIQMARWEAERGYRATYFILHTAPYWQDKDILKQALEEIAVCGHEIGFHLNAITEALGTGRNPVEIAAEAVGELREYGYPVRGVVAHGDKACYQHRFVNDEIFSESPRPDWGAPDRWVANAVKLTPIPRSALGFDYDPNRLPRGSYLSDSGGAWSRPFDEVVRDWPCGQLHMLVHPDWWSEAFGQVRAAA